MNELEQEYAKLYANKENIALLADLVREGTLTIEVAAEYAEKYANCPLEEFRKAVTRSNTDLGSARVSPDGRIIFPAVVRRLLDIKPGNRILFKKNQNDEVVIINTSAQARDEALNELFPDPFYSESNTRHLETLKSDVEDGTARFAEHPLL